MDNKEETVSEPVAAPKIGTGLAGPGRPKKARTQDLEKQAEPLNKRVDSLRYSSSVLASRLAHEIRETLDSTLPKKEKARLVRELTWSYGVLLDKASGGTDNGMVEIKFPAEVLAALKVGVALQVAPKPVIQPPVIVQSTS